MEFLIHKKDKTSKARLGTIDTGHGTISTPAFVTVGTKATVKGLTPEHVRQTGAEVVLANTYHLYLEPGTDVIDAAGGFGKFMDWHGPTMTDSGGFQVFSLGAAFGTSVSKVARGDISTEDSIDHMTGDPVSAHAKLAVIDEEGVTFKSYLDGSEHRFTPERSMEIQWSLGADMIFAFDECTSPTAPHEYQRAAMDRTHRWADRCIARHNELDPENRQWLFGVVQGGRFQDLRQESARELAAKDFDGFGIGGSFNKDDLAEAVGWVTEILPDEKPRHLLGIGEPMDVLMGIAQGIDLFDCVAPTRMARTGTLHTYDGRLNIMNAQFKNDMTPVDAECPCELCSKYTRAYLAHLFRSKEMLAGVLASIHNLTFMQRMMKDARMHLENDTFHTWKDTFLRQYYK
jgi:queuine tRNA-ribosyltransferase